MKRKLEDGGVGVLRECRMKASTKSLAAFGSSILKFAVMLDVAILSPRFPLKGITPPKKNKFSLTKIAARVNRGAAANCTFETVFQAVSSFFTEALLKSSSSLRRAYPPVADRREAVARVVRISPRLIYRAEASKMRRRIVSTVYCPSSFHFQFTI